MGSVGSNGLAKQGGRHHFHCNICLGDLKYMLEVRLMTFIGNEVVHANLNRDMMGMV